MASFLGQAPRDSRQEQARLRRLKKYGGKQGSDFVYHEPACLHWTCEQVADWIAGDDVGMPKYAPSFVSNMVNGRKLVMVTANSLPQLGVTDLKEIKHIAKKVRELLDMDEPDWRTRYSKPTIGFLEWRSRTGGRTDGVAFEYSPYAKYM